VKKVVLTSSAAAILYGDPKFRKTHFNDKDWTDVNSCHPYEKSKTLAERKAWEIYE